MRKILILLAMLILSSSVLHAQDAVHEFELGSNPRLLKFSPNNRLLLALRRDGLLRVAELDTGNVVDINFDVSRYRVSFMDISPDSQYALVSLDTEIYLVDLVSYTVVESYSNDNMIAYLFFVLDGVGFVTHSLGLKFWNIADGSSFLLTSQTSCSFPCIALCAIMDETTSPLKFSVELKGGEQESRTCQKIVNRTQKSSQSPNVGVSQLSINVRLCWKRSNVSMVN